MGIKVHAMGPTSIFINTESATDNTKFEMLGYSRDGIQVQEISKMLDVPGDQHGGQEGIPIDFQFMAEEHQLRGELTRYDMLVLDKLRARVRTADTFAEGSAGHKMVLPGTLLLGTDSQAQASAKIWQVVLLSDDDIASIIGGVVTPNAPALKSRRYYVSVPSEPIVSNHGTKYQMAQVGFRCIPIETTHATMARVLWNRVLTGISLKKLA